jgi:hypothetical protein
VGFRPEAPPRLAADLPSATMASRLAAPRFALEVSWRVAGRPRRLPMVWRRAPPCMPIPPPIRSISSLHQLSSVRRRHAEVCQHVFQRRRERDGSGFGSGTSIFPTLYN